MKCGFNGVKIMGYLPEKIRGVLERLVSSLKNKKNVVGVGLFGSWSRGDAVSSSDVDVLIIDEGNVNYEYFERVEMRGLLIDLDYIPKKWLLGVFPPEIDQKIYESQVLYDRDWTLTNTKEWMAKAYHTLERIAIRTEAHMVDADIYLSRATSAYSREDYQSAQIFAGKAVETILKILVEACRLPTSNSRLIRTMERAAEKLGMLPTYAEYLAIAHLYGLEKEDVEKKLGLFKNVWDEISVFVKRNKRELESSHFRVKTKLKYYLSPSFMQGVILRSKALIDEQNHAEACHYVLDTLLDMLENYAWLKSKVEKTKIDQTTLMRSLKDISQENPNIIYEKAAEAFNVENADQQKTQQKIQQAKQIVLTTRKQRRKLIEGS